MPGLFDDAPMLQTAATTPGFTGYIPAAPPKPEIEKPPSGFRPVSGGRLAPIPGGPADPYRPGGELDPNKPGNKKETDPALTAAIKSLGLEELLLGVANARKAVTNDPNWVTGVGGAILSNIPGTAAADYQGDLTSLQGGIIMEKLQALKEASKTGASGLGALSEKEGDRLATSVAALSGKLSADKMKESLQQVERHARTLQAIGAGEDPRDPAVAKKYGIPPVPVDISPTGGADNAGDQPPAISDADVQAQLRNRVARGDAPDETIAWLIGLGRVPNKAEISAIIANYKNPNPTVEPPNRPPIAAHQLGVSLGGIVESAGDLVGIVSNPWTAGVNAVFGTNYSTDTGRSWREGLGLPEADNDTERTINAVGEGALSTLLPLGVAKAGIKYVEKPVRAALESFLNSPRLDMLAGGTGAGAAEITRQNGGGALAQIGAGIAAGGGVSLPSILRSARGPQGIAPTVAEAADRLNVRIPAKLMAGGRKAINKAGVLEADPSAAPIIQEGFRRSADDIETAVGRLGQSGEAVSPAEQGETFRQIAKDIRRVDREGATAAYDAADKIQPDAMPDPAQMRAAIDAKLTQLKRRPNQNAETIEELETFRADLNKPLPLQEIRDMRTEAYDNINGSDLSRSSGQKRADRFLMQVIDASRKDIEAALTPEALAAWKAADKLYGENQQLYKESLKPLFGDDFDKLSAEQIFDRVKAAANKNGRALAGFHRRLTPEQSRNFAATIADSMGRKGPASDGEVFTPALFIQQARKFSPSARETIFGPSGADAMNSLLRLSRKLEGLKDEIKRSKNARPLRQAMRAAVGNFLNTALGGGGAVAGGMAGGGAGAMAGGTAGLVASQAIRAGGRISNAMSAKALMNPRVARWMLQTADVSTPQEAREAVRRLGVVIAREPGVENDLQPLHDALSQQVATRAAASEAPANGNDDER